MSVFAVMSLDNRQIIKAKADELSFPCYPIGTEGLLVSFKGTSQELATKLGLSDGTSGRGVVIAISNYYGFAPEGIWEWINVHWND